MARSAPQSAQRYPLTAILGTDGGVRVLRELSRHGGQLSAPDLVRRARLAQSSVAHALTALEATTIVAAAGSARARLYRVRSDHPLAAPLAALFEAEEARFQAVMDVVRAAAAGRCLVALWVYGSAARGDDRPGSDVDVAVICKPGPFHLASAASVRDALIEPAERLGFRPSVVVLATDDVGRLAAEHDPWWLGVVADAIALLGEGPKDLATRLVRSGETRAARP